MMLPAAAHASASQRAKAPTELALRIASGVGIRKRGSMKGNAARRDFLLGSVQLASGQTGCEGTQVAQSGFMLWITVHELVSRFCFQNLNRC